MPDRHVLVLAGGRGERFWPWSRPERPKQLLPLARGGRSLLAATLERSVALVPSQRIIVLTARDLVDAVKREAAPFGVTRVIGEPEPKNTAAAIAAAASLVLADGGDPAFAVLPADHAIDAVEAFAADLGLAFGLAEREPVLVTIGIPPVAPETNFGYIRRGDSLGPRVFRVAQFTEKPDHERAVRWVESGDYRWNAGIFVWRASAFLAGLAAGRPELARAFQSLTWTGGDAGFERLLERVFPKLESISVDYAVLEPAPNVVMIEASFDWDDLGSWGAWARRQPRDARGNVLFGDALALDCDGCVVVGEDGTAAALGLEDMVVVHAGGATLSCRLDETDRVRRVSEALRERSR